MGTIVLGSSVEEEIEAMNDLCTQPTEEVKAMAKAYLLTDILEMINLINQEPYDTMELLNLASATYRKILFSILMILPQEVAARLAGSQMEDLTNTLNHAFDLKAELTKMAEARKHGN